MEDEFKLQSWDEVSNQDFDLLASGSVKQTLFQNIGYGVSKSGELIDLTKNAQVKVIGSKDEIINLKDFPSVSFISGSHNFVRNIAEYSDFLAEKGSLKFESSGKDS